MWTAELQPVHRKALEPKPANESLKQVLTRVLCFTNMFFFRRDGRPSNSNRSLDPPLRPLYPQQRTLHPKAAKAQTGPEKWTL